jgi:hypothetical protein
MDQTESDFREIERARELPPDELYDSHRFCPDEEGLCRHPDYADECPNVDQETDDAA